MVPVQKLPVDHLNGRVVSMDFTLANGSIVFGVLGNIKVNNLRKTQQYLLLTLFKNRQRFILARYFDSDYVHHGPIQAASFLGLSPEAVFPIAYDISKTVNGPNSITVSTIAMEPSEHLSLSERIKL